MFADTEESLAVRPVIRLARVAAAVVGVARTQQQDLPGSRHGPYEKRFLLVGLRRKEASTDGIQASALAVGQQRRPVGATGKRALHQAEYEHGLKPAGAHPMHGEDLYRIL